MLALRGELDRTIFAVDAGLKCIKPCTYCKGCYSVESSLPQERILSEKRLNSNQDVKLHFKLLLW